VRKQTRRKILPAMSGLEIVARKTAPPSREIALRVLISLRSSIEALRAGRADRNDWEEIAFCINAAVVLSRNFKLGDEYMGDLLASRDAALALGKRAAASGKFVATGPELNAIRLMADIFEAQIEAATSVQLDKSVDMVRAEQKRSPLYVIIKEKT
jgi:hypothetical protein